MTHPSPKDRAIRLLREAGIARPRDLEGRGVSRKQLRRLCERGHVERIGRGLYVVPGAVLTEKHSLAEACRRVPNGVVCLLSALRFHELTTQNPFEVWMAIEQKAWRPRQGSPRLRLIHLSGRAFREGVEEHDVGGVPVRVFSAAKTVADCFKFRNKIGIDVAVEALRDFTQRYRGGANDLARFARICRVQRVMQPYLDSVSCEEFRLKGRSDTGMPPREPLTIVGMPGSPYSRKLRAVLRYRRIPHAWVLPFTPEARGLPRPRVALLPQLVLPAADGTPEASTDSTPLIRRLEGMYAGRAVVPPDPVVAFLDTLVEDYADEWLTKAMFHYRWAYPSDIAQAAAILPRWSRTAAPEAEAVTLGKAFAERQIGRLAVVGANEPTAPVIEESYRRLLALLDARLAESRFVMGGRPGASDFALYGQLTQLVGFDPTPRAIALQAAPRVVAWVDGVEDLSGLEPEDADWLDRDDVPTTLRALLAEMGRVYVPFLLANAAALERGAERVECTIAGRPWVQQPFPYQRKCLGWLRADHDALGPDDRRRVDTILAGTGCEGLFVGGR